MPSSCSGSRTASRGRWKHGCDAGRRRARPMVHARLVRVLVVEADEHIAQPLVAGLRRFGFEPDWVTSGAAALASPDPDVVLLDLGLPDMDGLDVCRSLRARSAVPILVITARGEE